MSITIERAGARGRGYSLTLATPLTADSLHGITPLHCYHEAVRPNRRIGLSASQLEPLVHIS